MLFWPDLQILLVSQTCSVAVFQVVFFTRATLC